MAESTSNTGVLQTSTTTFSFSSKVETRDDNNAYVFVSIPQRTIDSLWSIVFGNHVSRINLTLAHDGLINEVVQRKTIHDDQPFHDIPPHFSIAYNTTVTDPLKQIEEAIGSLDLELEFNVTNIKLVLPSMNGSLSLVYAIKLAAKSEVIMNELAHMLGEPRLYGWHITVGQSFYKPKLSQAIFNLNRENNVNISRIDEKKSKELDVFESWNLVQRQDKYFKETLMPHLDSMGYEVGYYKGEKDHIVIPFDDA